MARHEPPAQSLTEFFYLTFRSFVRVSFLADDQGKATGFEV